MELVHGWAQDLVALPAPARVQEILDNAGLPVDAVHAGVQLPDTVVVGHVLKAEKHPNADRLKVTEVDTGAGAPHTIVCGAPNVAQGQKVVVALPGTLLPNGIRLEKVRIRGIESNGMICAEDELGIGADHTGIIALSSGAKVGAKAGEYLKGKDTVYTVAITPNRADCLSVIGLAREIAAAEGKKLPTVQRTKEVSGKSPVRVKIADKKACSLLFMQRMTNVKVVPSPKWMQGRLSAAGMRPINNVVDITNYVLLELGRPLHAFDAKKLTGNTITARRAKAGEQLITLDGVNRKLTPEMIVIADEKGPVALGGVMGGKDTAVTEGTTDVVLEAAVFDPQSIYNTSHELDLVSESSQRFAKGVDREMTLVGLQRATALFMELAGAKPVGGPVMTGEEKEKHAAVRVDVERVNAFLGVGLSRAQMVKYLKALGMTVTGTAKVLNVIPPSWRHDIVIPEDVVEEIARLYGYNAIPRTVPAAPGIPTELPALMQRERALREKLVRLRAHEHVGYAYVPKEYVTDEQTAVHINNPLSKEQEYMRTSLLPGLYALVEKNAKRVEDFHVFEFGKTYARQGSDFSEANTLALIAVNRKPFFREFRGLAEALLETLGNKAQIAQGAEKLEIRMNGAVVGEISEPTARDRLAFKLPQHVWTMTLLLDAFTTAQTDASREQFHPIPQFPPVKRDLAFFADPSHTYAELHAFISRFHKLLTGVELFDVFERDSKKSYALHLTFSASTRTLEAGEIEAILDTLRSALKDKFGAAIR